MKRLFIFLILLLSSIQLSAQEGSPRHEVKWNIANTIIFASVEVGYEYFLDEHQSVGAEFLINDVYNFSIGRESTDFKTNSFQLTYNYYTAGAERSSGFVISPMLKFRTGEYQKIASEPVINMNSFILGAGVGYEWNLSNKFVFGPYATIGRNFSEEVNEEFNIAVEFNAGFGIGYRF